MWYVNRFSPYNSGSVRQFATLSQFTDSVVVLGVHSITAGLPLRHLSHTTIIIKVLLVTTEVAKAGDDDDVAGWRLAAQTRRDGTGQPGEGRNDHAARWIGTRHNVTRETSNTLSQLVLLGGLNYRVRGSFHLRAA